MPGLDAFLSLLDDADITEVVLTSGQPVTTKNRDGYTPVGKVILTTDDVRELLSDTPLARMLDAGGAPLCAVQLGGRTCRAEVNVFGAQLMVRLLRAMRSGGAATPVRGVPIQPARSPDSVVRSVRLPPSASARSPDSVERAALARPAASARSPDSVERAALARPAPAARPPAPAARAVPAQPSVSFTGLQLDAPSPAASLDLPAASTPEPVAPRARPPAARVARPATEPEPEPEPAAPPRGRPRAAPTIPPITTTQLPPLRPITAAPAPRAFIALVEQARQHQATDLHVTSGLAAMVRGIAGLTPLGAPLDGDAVDALLLPLLSPPQRTQLETRGYVDAAIDLGPVARLRANISRTRLGLKGTFRVVLPAPPTLEQLQLPAELARITSYHQGLVVIAGPNGHGKTTTLAALIDLINSTKPHHILTVEDPVEIIHPRKRALMSQREVGTHTVSFAAALKASLREDPDVIVIGELRDRETVEIALTAAETGHLVMATMSTPSASKTLDRLIDMFPADDQPQVRSSLAAALRFVLAQRLLPSADGKGLVAAVELVTGVLPLAALIRDDKLYQLASLLQRGRAFGMIRLDDSLLELVRAGRITEDVALGAAEGRKEMLLTLRPAAAPEPAAAPTAGSRVADLKQRFGGLFGKKDKE